MWTWVPIRPTDPTKSWTREDAYDCHHWCFPGGRENYSRRCAFRCALPDFGPPHWEPNGEVPTYWLGGEEAGQAESHEDGCPGSWARCGFVRSLFRYQRFRGQGVFSENVLLSRCEDPLVLEAVHLWECEVLRAEAHFLDVATR